MNGKSFGQRSIAFNWKNLPRRRWKTGIIVMITLAATGCASNKMASIDSQALLLRCKTENFSTPQFFVHYQSSSITPVPDSLTQIHKFLPKLKEIGVDGLLLRTFPTKISAPQLNAIRLQQVVALLEGEGFPALDLYFQPMGLSDRAFSPPNDPPSSSISVVPVGFGRTREIARHMQCARDFIRDCVSPGGGLEAACKTAAAYLTGEPQVQAVP